MPPAIAFRMVLLCWLWCCCCGSMQQLQAQTSPPAANDTTLSSTPTTAPPDTLRNATAIADTLPPTLSDSLSRRQRRHSAGQAAMWSLIPGAGHAYNKQYYKVPIYGGAIAGLGALSVQQYTQYRRYYRLHTNALADQALGIPNNTDLTPIVAQKRSALRRYNIARNATIAIYALNIADAYASNWLQSEPPKAHSPFRAAYRSGILPGWGQAYNGKAWKIPIIYGGFAALGYSIYSNGAAAERYKQTYLARTRPGYGIPDDRLAPISPDNLLRVRTQYKRYYDLSIIGASLWYIINIADAVIDAHLYKFDTSDDLSHQLHLYPHWQTHPITQQAVGGVSLCFSF